jgi:hypothetical protein
MEVRGEERRGVRNFSLPLFLCSLLLFLFISFLLFLSLIKEERRGLWRGVRRGKEGRGVKI